MCTTCGCGPGETQIHTHDHTHGHGETHIPMREDERRLVAVEQDILSKNNFLASLNRQAFRRQNTTVLNLMSSPGSGKTTLLVETLKALKEQMSVAVIEGDQQTQNDADRIRETGVEAVQVNTGKGCHLDAQMIASAMERMTVPSSGVLFIENVGNLVCPASFDLGEDIKVVLASVTEGEDKPLKYPEMFAVADVVVISKCDLLPHLHFDVDLLIENAKRMQPSVQIIKTAATAEGGLSNWLTWLDEAAKAPKAAAE